MVEVGDQIKGLVISRFGVIPKRGQGNQWRLILDLSHPTGRSVNDGISRELSSLSYASVDQAVERILELGPGTLLAKCDIKQAYRNVPVHPEDRFLLGMEFEGRTYVDTTLPFGLRSAPKLFTALAEALEWCVKRKGLEWLLKYIDDFLIMGRRNTDECSGNLRTFIACCSWLGLPLKEEKVEGPATTIVFLGIMLDTEKMEIRLPEERVQELRRLLDRWALRKACKKRELLSLIGKLAHACKVVRVGRIFLCRMIDLSTTAAKLEHWIHLSAQFRADLSWWRVFLPTWNHRCMMYTVRGSQLPDVTIATDASGMWGCGAVWQNTWLQLAWDAQWVDKSIAAKELIPIVLACALWGKQWQYKRVCVKCDNMSVVQVIAGLSSRDPLLMHLLRLLYFYLALYNIQLRAEHVHNTIADAVSRNLMQVFSQLLPSANVAPTAIPARLKELLGADDQVWLSPAWRESLRASSLIV